MSFWEVILLLVLVVLVGGLAQVISGFSIIGFIFSIITGFAGALFGGWASAALGSAQIITIGEMNFAVWPILGAIMFTAFYGVIFYRRVE